MSREARRSTAPFVEGRGSEERCGTAAGFSRHQKRGEPVCERCKQAKSDWDLRWRSGDAQTRRNRLHAKAQGRALSALAKAHPDEYRRLYLAFKEQFLKEVEAS